MDEGRLTYHLVNVQDANNIFAPSNIFQGENYLRKFLLPKRLYQRRDACLVIQTKYYTENQLLKGLNNINI